MVLRHDEQAGVALVTTPLSHISIGDGCSPRATESIAERTMRMTDSAQDETDRGGEREPGIVRRSHLRQGGTGRAERTTDVTPLLSSRCSSVSIWGRRFT